MANWWAAVKTLLRPLLSPFATLAGCLSADEGNYRFKADAPIRLVFPFFRRRSPVGLFLFYFLGLNSLGPKLQLTV